MPEHVVRQGECLASIAKKHGFPDWRTIYNHPRNADFRRLRPDPNVILPDDVLFIPDHQQREEAGNTEARHRYRYRAGKVLLRLILLDEQRNPWRDRAYQLSIGDLSFSGATNGEGLLEVEIPCDAERGVLSLSLPVREAVQMAPPRRVDQLEGAEDPDSPQADAPAAPDSPGGTGAQPAEGTAALEATFKWNLAIGHLDPVEEITGIQGRLHNLGFNPGPIDGISGPRTEAAVRRFQRASGLRVDGIAGPQTKAKLNELHGC